jgi:adenosylcobalamin-dependent ribonucleoside-triphosphate reductase
MARSIWEDKYARTVGTAGAKEGWSQRVAGVVSGNTGILEHVTGETVPQEEFDAFLHHMRSGVLPMSGRHLQQGDKDQFTKKGELFTNCATAGFTFLKFWLLMKGCGVGRLYDEAVCTVDWGNLPNMVIVIADDHPDWDPELLDKGVLTLSQAETRYGGRFRSRWFTVPDSAEGWAQAVMLMETAAYHGYDKNWNYVLDFSEVRGAGKPIVGQQNRPASGPVPLMLAILEVQKIARVEGTDCWEQAIRIDHEFAACVVMGGVRRSARIGIKTWDDVGIEKFIHIKESGGLWSANNSVGVTEKFWELVQVGSHNVTMLSQAHPGTHLWKAMEVFHAVCEAAYYHNSGEPGFLNVDKLSVSSEGLGNLDSTYLHETMRKEFGFTEENTSFVNDTLNVFQAHRTQAICNPCGEVPLPPWGGYCVIADLCLANAYNPEEIVDAGVLASRALVRANLMEFLYRGEVLRTNRIGVSLTGIHEFAYEQFTLTWHDLVGPLEGMTLQFWLFLKSIREAIKEDLISYCKELGVSFPHSFTCIKPSGTVSKVLWCTEGGHLPPYSYYMRWVMFPIRSPQLTELKERGYPTKDVSHQYTGHHVVGFPTRTRAAELMGDDIVLAGEATVEEQYTWIQRLEEFWLGPKGEGGQVSYTLKYNKKQVPYPKYRSEILLRQHTVRACAAMPQVDLTAYAYQPEEPITAEEYEMFQGRIDRGCTEAYDSEALTCDGGACPIELDL